MRPRIMVVAVIEDEISLSQFIQRHLLAESFSSYTISTKEDLEGLFGQQKLSDPDIIILDRLFENLDLATQISKFKATFPDAKIIVLSAIGTAKERARVLALGADDYLNKPFEIEELIARIQVLQRRVKGRAPAQNIIEGVTLKEDFKDLEVRGKRLNLTKKEYLLASLFLNNPNKVFSRLKLLDTVWEIQADVESNVVEVTISHLRRKFESEGLSLKILSRRNIGYWLEV